jgi:hypothetical protein
MSMRASRNSHTTSNGQYPAALRSARAAPTPKERDDREQGERSEAEGLKLPLKHCRELGEYFSYYVTAKADSVKLSLRAMVLWIASAALGFVTVAALIISASWFILSGMAQGLGVLFGDRLWLGKMTTGLLLAAALGLGMYYAVSKRIRASRERTVQKYEERQARQREQFGRDVSGQAAAPAYEKR